MNGSPTYICDFCGETYGVHTCHDSAKWHLGECEVCGDEEVLVTAKTAFGGLHDNYRDGMEGA